MLKKIWGMVIVAGFLIIFSSCESHAFITNQPADVVIGQVDMTGGSSNQEGAASATTLHGPADVGIVNGQMLIADASNQRVLLYNIIPGDNNIAANVVVGQSSMTSIAVSVGASGLHNPTGAIGIAGKLFIADNYNHRVLIFNDLPVFNGASANLVIGQTNMIAGGAGLSSQRFYHPARICSDEIKLVISDQHNHRVLIFNAIPTSDYAAADVVIGQATMTTGSANQGGGAAASTLYYPFGVSTYGGRLFVADQANHRVLIYYQIPAANNAPADIVIGQPNMTSNAANQGGGPAANTLQGPLDVCYDGTRLFIADTGNNRVLVYNQLPTSNNAVADAVLGQPNMTSNAANQGGEVAAHTLKVPFAVFSTGDQLMVADTDNHRILIYFSANATSTPVPTVTPQGSSSEANTFCLKIMNNQINPVRRERAVIRWTQPATGPVTIAIYSLLGNRVTTLIENQIYTSDQYHEVYWDGSNSQGQEVGSGIYIAHIKTGTNESRGKIAVIK